MRRALLVLLIVGACTREVPAADHGAEVFQDPGFSNSEFNHDTSCATCHQTDATPDLERIDPGYSLHGVAARSSYWGGKVFRLEDAVNTCLIYFMRGQELDTASDDARALYEYLLSLTPDNSPSDPLPMTVVETIAPIPFGDATRGGEVYRKACQHCHGAAHTGDGIISDFGDTPVILPEYAEQEYPTIFGCDVPLGMVVIEKIRHGRFFDVGGYMPLFSTETLSDSQIGDLLAFLNLSAEDPPPSCP